MSFFINDAWAQATGAGEPSLLTGMLPLILIFVVFYFLLIRPQSKRAKEHKAMVEALSKGDEVVTAGGILGKITGVSDHYAVVQIADNTEIKIQKGSVSQVVPKGTFEEA